MEVELWSSTNVQKSNLYSERCEWDGFDLIWFGFDLICFVFVFVFERICEFGSGQGEQKEEAIDNENKQCHTHEWWKRKNFKKKNSDYGTRLCFWSCNLSPRLLVVLFWTHPIHFDKLRPINCFDSVLLFSFLNLLNTKLHFQTRAWQQILAATLHISVWSMNRKRNFVPKKGHSNRKQTTTTLNDRHRPTS